jgi:hypothetical protein
MVSSWMRVRCDRRFDDRRDRDTVNESTTRTLLYRESTVYLTAAPKKTKRQLQFGISVAANSVEFNRMLLLGKCVRFQFF